MQTLLCMHGHMHTYIHAVLASNIRVQNTRSMHNCEKYVYWPITSRTQQQHNTTTVASTIIIIILFIINTLECY